MRNVLIDYARSFRAAKRNKGQLDSLVDEQVASPTTLDLIIGLRRAMDTIGATDPRMVAVLQMRFRDGFTLDETAKALKVSGRTAKRVLRLARGRLCAALS